MQYKNQTIFSLIAIVFFSIVLIPSSTVTANDEISATTLVYGTRSGPYDLDPLQVWDSSSTGVITQVVETLFTYDLNDPENSIIPQLASNFSMCSLDGLSWIIPLKEDIFFHDGTSFNAQAVKWNFDRLAHFMNIDGTLPPETDPLVTRILYEWSDGTPIINATRILDTYTIEFILNQPYAPFEALLCFIGSSILSPTSTPYSDYIDTETGVLFGTGPFVYDYYTPNVEVKFHAFEDYWSGVAEIDELTFSIIQDQDARAQALINKDIDIIDRVSPSMIPDFIDNPDIIVNEAGTSTGLAYLGMNNNLIDKPMRQAISHAIDYSYLINELLNGNGERVKSFIPNGVKYANDDFNVATLDVLEARQILVDAGKSDLDVTDDAGWVYAANSEDPIAKYKYSYNIGNAIREDLSVLLQDNLEQIGIKIIDEPLSWSEFLNKLFDEPDTLNLWCLGWIGDFNDPHNILEPLLSSNSMSNIGQVNDPFVEDLIEQGVSTIDPIAREAIYDEIQQYLVEDLMPCAYLYVSRITDAYLNHVSGYRSNGWSILRFYDVSLNPELYVEFESSSTSIKEGETVDFTFKGSEGSAPAEFLWDFGDGFTSDEVNPSHIYESVGTYTVSLTVIDADGDSETLSKENYIEVNVDLKPIAKFKANRFIVFKHRSIDFTFTGTGGNGETIYSWNFGDGNTSDEMNPSYTYTRGGIFYVSLTITDIDGDSSTYTKKLPIVVIPLSLRSI